LLFQRERPRSSGRKKTEPQTLVAHCDEQLDSVEPIMTIGAGSSPLDFSTDFVVQFLGRGRPDGRLDLYGPSDTDAQIRRLASEVKQRAGTVRRTVNLIAVRDAEDRVSDDLIPTGPDDTAEAKSKATLSPAAR
jgi:hypothetical protein